MFISALGCLCAVSPVLSGEARVLVEGLLRGHWLFHSMGDLNPLLDHMTLSTPPLGDVITWQVRTTYSLAWYMHPLLPCPILWLVSPETDLLLWPMRN